MQKQVLVIGAGHGIGLALVKQLLNDKDKYSITATYRDSSKAEGLLALSEDVNIYQLDPCNETMVRQFSQETQSTLDQLFLIINCVGFLHDKTMLPEKNVSQITSEKLQHYFKVNTTVTPLLAKYFGDTLKNKNKSYFVSLSAKIGSIEDNRIGGWYGYRASKAALNMIIKCLAIEFARYGSKCVFLAIHPGTTITSLSEPYIKNTSLKLHTAEESAKNILKVIFSKDFSGKAEFYSWDDTKIKW